MKIRTASPFLADPVKAASAAHPQTDLETPGVLLNIDCILATRPHLQKSAGERLLPVGNTDAACMVMPQRQVETLFDEKNLEVLKTISGHILREINPHLKQAADAIWLIYGFKKLHDAWQRTDTDLTTCLFEAVGLGMKTATLSASLVHAAPLPDPWINGINFAVKCGDDIHVGRTPPVGEMLLSQQDAGEITLALQKWAAATFDPAYPYAAARPLQLHAESR